MNIKQLPPRRRQLTAAQRATRQALAAERAELRAALAAYEAQPAAPVVVKPEPSRYTVTVLTSAVTRKAAAAKAADTRRRNRYGLV